MSNCKYFVEFITLVLFSCFHKLIAVRQNSMKGNDINFRKEKRYSLREKCPNSEFFPVRIFAHLDWIRRFAEYLSAFTPNTGKYEPEKTPYLDTFHAVYCLKTGKKIILNWLPQILIRSKSDFKIFEKLKSNYLEDIYQICIMVSTHCLSNRTVLVL